MLIICLTSHIYDNIENKTTMRSTKNFFKNSTEINALRTVEREEVVGIEAVKVIAEVAGAASAGDGTAASVYQ